MENRQIRRIPGMRDVSACALERLSRSAETLFRFFGQHGYQMINTPLLEETELFVRKSGGELTSRLHTFRRPRRTGDQPSPRVSPHR